MPRHLSGRRPSSNSQIEVRICINVLTMSLRLPRHHDADSSTLASTPAHPRRPGVDTVYSVCDGRCVTGPLKTYVREARIAYLTSFDGLAGVASIVSILQLRGQASFGFLRVLRLYRLAKMVGHGVVVYQLCCLVCTLGEHDLFLHLHIAMLRCRARRWWTIGTLLLLLWRRARGARSPASSPSC